VSSAVYARIRPTFLDARSSAWPSVSVALTNAWWWLGRRAIRYRGEGGAGRAGSELALARDPGGVGGLSVRRRARGVSAGRQPVADEGQLAAGDGLELGGALGFSRGGVHV